MRSIKCCTGCSDRSPGCHELCVRYFAEYLAETEVHEKIFREKGKAHNADSFVIGQAIKQRR